MQNSETKPITLLFDLETTPLEAQKTDIHCIVTLDYETGETTRYNDIGGEQPIVRAVQYLEDAQTIIGHNIIGFDIPVIKKIYPWFNPKGRIIDTLLLSRLYHPNMLDVDRKAKAEGYATKAVWSPFSGILRLPTWRIQRELWRNSQLVRME